MCDERSASNYRLFHCLPSSSLVYVHFRDRKRKRAKNEMSFSAETKTKTATYFRPKMKTKLSSSSNNMRQSNVLLCEYSNDAAKIQNYKNSRY